MAIATNITPLTGTPPRCASPPVTWRIRSSRHLVLPPAVVLNGLSCNAPECCYPLRQPPFSKSQKGLASRIRAILERSSNVRKVCLPANTVPKTTYSKGSSLILFSHLLFMAFSAGTPAYSCLCCVWSTCQKWTGRKNVQNDGFCVWMFTNYVFLKKMKYFCRTDFREGHHTRFLLAE